MRYILDFFKGLGTASSLQDLQRIHVGEECKQSCTKRKEMEVYPGPGLKGQPYFWDASWSASLHGELYLPYTSFTGII